MANILANIEKTLPKVVDKVQSYMVYLEQLFEVPEEIRKAIYTSNATRIC